MKSLFLDRAGRGVGVGVAVTGQQLVDLREVDLGRFASGGEYTLVGVLGPVPLAAQSSSTIWTAFGFVARPCTAK